MAVFWPAGVSAANLAQVHLAGEPRLVRAAHEFEAQLMKELLRPLTQSSKLWGDGDADETGGAGTLGEFAAESLAGSLSAHGGVGIANRIVDDLSRSGNTSQYSQVREKPHVDTVMNLRK
jgi:Rod binding domain-containing protein